MKHRALQEDVCLLALGDLDESAQQGVRDHMRACTVCRGLYDEVVRLAAAAAAFRTTSDLESLRTAARTEFLRTLRKEASRPRWRERWLGALTLPSPQTVRIALGGAVLLAAGVLIGRSWFAPGVRSAVPPDYAAGQVPRIANVRFQHLRGETDSIAVQYDEVTPIRIAGTLQDPAIQKALLRAVVTDDNPGVRLRAVTTLALPASAESDREVKAALMVVLRSDPNAGVRKQALRALCRLPFDEAVKNALINTLMHDQNPGLRVDAINSLDSVVAGNVATDRALIDAFREKAARDENTYVQWKARAVLREAKIQ